MMTFAEQLREGRMRAHLSQNALAARVGVDAAYIHRMEKRAACHPSREVVEQIARVLVLSDQATAELLVAAGYWPWAGNPQVSALMLDLGARVGLALESAR